MSAAGPKRRPAAGGYTRGDEKREHIIETALRIFGELGYDKASTRQIAEAAGVNPPALQYYFESKEGLLNACIDHAASLFSDTMQPTYDAAAALPGDASPADAAAALCAITDKLAEYLLGSDAVARCRKFFARLEVSSAQAIDLRYKQRVSLQMREATTRLVAIAIRQPPDSEATKLKTFAILGQLMIFHLTYDKALGALGWPDFRGERLEQIKQLVRSHIMLLLTV